jgi:hypothetical protein
VDCRSQWPRGLRRRFAAAEIVGSNPTDGMVVSVVSVIWCHVQFSATRSAIECGASLCAI